jgi:hypothetical protein
MKKIIITTIVVFVVAAFALLIRNAVLPASTVCTADAKQCPDGSYVGRTGSDCQFQACPGDSFVQCVAADNPVMESYPRQCRWENGTTVIEVIV